jgi:iron complex outermembrane receptor protein
MRSIFVLGLLNISILSFAQHNETGSIKGLVKTSDGEPAGSVSVLIKNTHIGTLTNENGRFEFRRIKPGNYILVFSLSGYFGKDSSVLVKENEQAILNVHLEQTYAELQKVIITSGAGTKYVETNPSSSLRLNMPLNEIPQNITVTKREQLADQGLITMSEALRTVSGIQKNQGDLNDVTLNIRGVQSIFNIYRNGIGQYVWNQQEDIAMIEKIEFIKGPAGFIVSNFPPGGLVNIIIKQPQRDPVASVNAGYGSFNLFRLTTDWGGAFSKKSKFTYRFNAGLHHQQRAFQFSHAQRYFICGALKYEADNKNTITAEYNYMWGKTSGNNSYTPSLNGKLFALPRNFAVADSKTDNLIGADNYFRLLATHQFNNNWKINLLLGNIHGKWGQGYQLLADSYFPVTNDTLYRYAARDDWRSSYGMAQVYMNGTFYTGKLIEHKLFSAFDYCSSGGTDDWGTTDSKFGLYIPNPDYYVNPDSLKTFSYQYTYIFRAKNPSVYLEDHIKIKEKLIITLAGRFTHLSNTNITDYTPPYQQHTHYDRFTPRLGINWLFSDASSAYIVYNQFFFPVFQRNSERKPFKPSTGYNLEAGVKHLVFNNKLNAGLSVYKILINNALTPDPLHPDYYIQSAQHIHKGIEMDIAGNLTPAIIVNANYAFTDARVSKGDSNQVGKKKLGTPDHNANLWLKYRLLNGKLKGFSFALGYQYMGRRSAVFVDDPKGNIYLPVYNLFDAAISYRNEKFNINLNVYNLTNIQYATLGYFNVGNNEWRYTPGEPINFRLSVGVNLVNEKRHNKAD